MIPPYYVNVMYSKVVELNTTYRYVVDYFVYPLGEFRGKLKITTSTIKMYYIVWKMYGKKF